MYSNKPWFVLVIIVSIFALGASACRTIPVTEEKDTPKKENPEDTKKDPGKDKEPVKDPQADPEKKVTDENPDKKGRPVRTMFYGEELVREKVKVDGIEIVRVSIRGGATIDHEGVLIQAPLMVIDAGRKGRCEGGVVITDRKNGLVIRSARADYDRSEQKVVLSGTPYMISSKENQKPTLVTSDKMTRDLAENVSILGNDIRVYHEQWVLLGDEGKAFDKEDKIVIDNSPIAFGKQQILTGKKLTYFTAKKQMVMDGGISIVSKDSGGMTLLPSKGGPAGGPVDLFDFARTGGRAGLDKTGKPEKEPGPAFITADALVYSTPDKGEPVTELTGNVIFTRDAFALKSPHLVATGRDFNSVRTEEGADMRDEEQGFHATAGIMNYDRKAEKLYLEKEPKMEFLDKEKHEVQGTLTSAVIERDFKTKETIARGDVVIDRKTYSAAGEIATYRESEGVIQLEGDPSLKRGAGRVRCERILIYPDKNRLLMFNRIRGGMILQD